MPSLANQKSVFANDDVLAKHLPSRAKPVLPTSWQDSLANAEESLTVIERMLEAEEQSRVVKGRLPMSTSRYKRARSFVVRNWPWLATLLLTIAVVFTTLWLRFRRTR